VQWGWRIPFGLGILVGIFTLVFRNRIHEPTAVKTKIKNPIVVAFRYHCGTMVKIMVIIGFLSCSFYFIVIWLTNFMDALRYPNIPQAYTINTILMLGHVLLFHFFGKCIDRNGHRRRWIALGAGIVGLVRLRMPHALWEVSGVTFALASWCKASPLAVALVDIYDVGYDACAQADTNFSSEEVCATAALLQLFLCDVQPTFLSGVVNSFSAVACWWTIVPQLPPTRRLSV